MTARTVADHATQRTSEPPATPDGYDAPSRFDYSVVVLLLLSIPAFLLSSIGFGWVLWEIQGPAVFAAVFDVTETAEATTIVLDLVVAGVPFVVAVLVTVVGHELVHAPGTLMYDADLGRGKYRIGTTVTVDGAARGTSGGAEGEGETGETETGEADEGAILEGEAVDEGHDEDAESESESEPEPEPVLEGEAVVLVDEVPAVDVT